MLIALDEHWLLIVVADDQSQRVDIADASWDPDATVVANSNNSSSSSSLDRRQKAADSIVIETAVRPAMNTNSTVISDAENSRLTGAISDIVLNILIIYLIILVNEYAYHLANLTFFWLTA